MQTDVRKKIDNYAATKIIAFGKHENGEINFDENNNILISNYDIEKERRIDSPFNRSLGQPRIFKNCTFLNEVFVNYVECRISVYFSNCIFKSDVEIINSLGNEGSIFRDGCIFQNDLSITATNTSSNYKFEDFSVYNNLYIRGSYGNFLLSNINNKENSPNGNLIIGNSEKFTFKKLQIENSKFTCLKLFCGIAYEALIKNIKSSSIRFKQFIYWIEFYFRNVTNRKSSIRQYSVRSKQRKKIFRTQKPMHL